MTAPPPPDRWHTSSASANINCVQVRADDVVLVRNSSTPAGPVLEFPRDAWARFVDALRRGELRTPPG